MEDGVEGSPGLRKGEDDMIQWDAIFLNDNGRRSVVDHIYEKPLTDSEHHGVVKHTLVVDQYLLKVMADDASLDVLDISHSLCTDVAMVALTDAIQRNTTVKRLVLNGNPLTDVSAFLLAHALTVNRSITSLEATNVQFTEVGISYLAAALEVNDVVTSCWVDTDVLPGYGTEVQKIANLLRANQYRPSSVKEVYRMSRGLTPMQADRGVVQMSLACGQDNAGRVESTAEIDPWAFSFLCLSLQTWQQVAQPDELCRSVVVSADLRNVTGVDDSCIESIVRCLHSCASKECVSIRFGTIDLRGTSVTTMGVAKILEILEEEGDLILQSRAPDDPTALISEVLLDEGCPAIDEEVLSKLRVALSLRSEPKMVKKAALRLLKKDPTLLYLALAPPLARSDDVSEPSQAAVTTPQVTDTSLVVLLPMLKENFTLVSLAITHACLTDASAVLLGELLSSNCFLQVLDLRGNLRLCVRGAARYVASGLVQNRTLLSLNLSATGIDVEGGCEIAAALKRNRALTMLDVSNNSDLTGSAGDALRMVLGTSNQVLRELRLAGCGIEDDVRNAIEHRIREAHEPPALRGLLASLASNASCITAIQLVPGAQDVRLRDSSIELLATAIRGNPHITSINVSCNAITSDGMKIFCSSIGSDPTSVLHSLDLSNNPVNNVLDFAASVADLLRSHRCLDTLNISSTNLRSLGTQVILDALLEDAFPPTIHCVLCSDNLALPWQLTLMGTLVACHSMSSAVRAFIKTLWHAIDHANRLRLPQPISCVNARDLNRNPLMSPALIDAVCGLLELCAGGCHKLILSRNALGDEGVQVLARHLADGAHIVDVDLRDNDITDKGMESLLVAALKSNSLRNVRMGRNPQVTQGTLAALHEALRISRQPLFLKSTLIALCKNSNDPEGGVVYQAIDVSAQAHDHLTDERFEMLCDALAANPMLRITECNLANNHVGNKSFTKLVQFSKPAAHNDTAGVASGPSHDRVVDLHSVSFRNTMLSGEEVGKMVAELIVTVPSLTILDLSSNDLFTGPAGYDRFVKHGLPPIVSVLSEADHVMELDLSNCGLPDAVMEPILSILELNRSGLKSTIRQLSSQDPHLVSLSLSDMHLSRRSIVALISALADNHVLRDLDLSENAIGGDVATLLLQWIGEASAATPIVGTSPLRRSASSLLENKRQSVTASQHRSNLTQLPPCRLRSLVLDNNLFADEHAAQLHDALTVNPTLQSVSLVGNQISAEMIWETFVSNRRLFSCNDVLADFHLDGDGIDVFEFERFTNCFALNYPELRGVKSVLPLVAADAVEPTSLDFSNSDHYLCDTVCYELGEVLRYNTHVRTLRLANGNITDEGLLALCRSLMMNRSVTCLDLSCNHIGDTGVSALFDVLMINPSVKEVLLEGNPCIGAVGVAKLKSMLLANQSVTHVALDKESVPEASVDDIALGLLLNKSHPAIKQFLLSEPETLCTEVDVSRSSEAFPGSTVEDDACKLLCQHLASNTKVEVLNLSHNALTFESCYYVADLLRSNRSITALDMSHNYFGTGIFHLIKALHVNDVVTLINLDGCMGSEMYLHTIQLLVEVNKETTMLKSETLAMIEDPSHHRIFEVVGEMAIKEGELPQTRPWRKKLALDDTSMLSPTMCHVFELSYAIQDVRLPHNKISSIGLAEFCTTILPKHANVTALDLSHNILDDTCVQTLLDCTRSVLTLLRHVDLSFNLLTEACIPAATELLEVCAHVEKFAIRGHKDVSTASMERIAFLELMNQCATPEARHQFIRASHHDPTLKELQLKEYCADGQWKLNDHYMSLVGYALCDNPFVTALCLDDSGVDDALLAVLCDSVLARRSASCGLREISLHGNRIEDVSVLVETLLLGASGEGQSDDAAAADNNAPARCGGIRVLRLGSNSMTLKSARSLATLLRQCSTLEELDVSMNDWGRTGAVLVQSALCNSTSMLRIRLEAKGVPQSIIAAAQCAVQSNDPNQRRLLK